MTARVPGLINGQYRQGRKRYARDSVFGFDYRFHRWSFTAAVLDLSHLDCLMHSLRELG